MAVSDSVRQLDAILKPKSVAVIGASTSPDKIGHEVLKNILDSGFKGNVYPINPKAEMILDLSCHKSVKDIEKAPELAVIIIPARFVPQAIQECGEAGVKGAVVITGGFSEAGDEGEALAVGVPVDDRRGGGHVAVDIIDHHAGHAAAEGLPFGHVDLGNALVMLASEETEETRVLDQRRAQQPARHEPADQEQDESEYRDLKVSDVHDQKLVERSQVLDWIGYLRAGLADQYSNR